MSVVFGQLGLTRLVHCQNLGPYESEKRPQFLGLCGDELEHVRKYAHGESGAHRPRTKVKKLGEQLERLESMLLTEENLKHDGQLLGRIVRAHVVLEPSVEDLDLLGEEATGDKILVTGGHLRQLANAHVER